MKREEIRIGETYYLPVVATDFIKDGNMIRLVTADEGDVLYARPESLRETRKDVHAITMTKGEIDGQRKNESGTRLVDRFAKCV